MDAQKPKIGASAILCFDGKILLGLRSANDSSLPGLWCTPGGQVEFQELIDVAITREFLEETGVEVGIVPGFLSVQERIQDGKHSVLIFKEVLLINGSPQALDGFDDIGWFSREQLQDMFTQNKVTFMSESAIRQFWKK